MLIFTSVVTLTLNVAEPLTTGQCGKAAFDAVVPLLLIGWSEVGPPVSRATSANSAPLEPGPPLESRSAARMSSTKLSDSGPETSGRDCRRERGHHNAPGGVAERANPFRGA
ncbi:hypothetical protein AB0K15_47475 [Amycolatopsis sp. NPDC049253]|uniref:hypothetical protein n=1 Tax=Amycolatopsis sp. NPDC049253 TaxID=3155274 RepID=UPI00342F6A82